MASTAWLYVGYHSGNGVTVIERVATNAGRTTFFLTLTLTIATTFNIAGKTFQALDHSRQTALAMKVANSNLAVPAGTDTVDLYAGGKNGTLPKLLGQMGGTFSANSVFKQVKCL